MFKLSLNHVLVIKCGQIRKRCGNASIIGVSSLVHGFSNFFKKVFFHATLRPITREGTGRRSSSLKNFSPLSKMCWTYIITIGDFLKNGSLSENSSPPSVPTWLQAWTSLMDSLVVNDTCKRPITKLKRHFCLWRSHSNAHNPRK